ncbi:aldo/keto reductase, partial [Bacillus pumilus]|uniref:aldo/keto reductase n=1 Tax=Bacillus pumilus TaxID=1408 RepID=UPI001642ECD7
KRLQTHYIHLYYIHFPRRPTPLEQVTSTLNQFNHQPKITPIPPSNLHFQQLQPFNPHPYLHLLHSHYSFLKPHPQNHLLPYCLHHPISFIPYFP